MNGRNEKVEMGLWAACLLIILLVAARPILAGPSPGDSIFNDPYDAIGYEGPSAPGVEGYTMKYVNPNNLPSGWDSAVLLEDFAPVYHWWNGCSPTAAGMVFAYWEAYLGKTNLYTYHDGNSVYWNTSRMSESNQNNYGKNGVYPDCGTHSIVASWEHYQAGQALGLNHGSWDRNGNGVVDQSDRDQWNSLADFMRTQNGGTSRSTMAAGFEAYAAWDDPLTPANESYEAEAWTVNYETWDGYTAEIDANYPVHVGIPGHSIFGCGYWDDPNGVYGTPGTKYVVNRTTWGSTGNKYGLVEFEEVYAYTCLRIGDPEEPPNNPPVALDDTYSMKEDSTYTLYNYEGVLLNDSDADGDPLTAIKKTNTAHGALTFYSNGALSYTPDANYNGIDTFKYVANDTLDNSNLATVTFNITSVNDVPVAEDDSFSVKSGERLFVYNYEGVLENDFDVESQDLLQAILVSDVSHGRLDFYTNGALTYTPNPDFSGIDSFTYRAFDGEDYSELTTVLLEIMAGAVLIPGDTNGDYIVNEIDASVLSDNWNKAISGGFSVGDFNGDGFVNATDASILAAHWGDHTSEASAVPEPSSLGLLLSLVGILWLGRRHK